MEAVQRWEPERRHPGEGEWGAGAGEGRERAPYRGVPGFILFGRGTPHIDKDGFINPGSTIVSG